MPGCRKWMHSGLACSMWWWSGAPQCDLLQHTRFDRRLSGHRHGRVWQFAQRSYGLQHWFKLKALLWKALHALIDGCSTGQPVEAFL